MEFESWLIAGVESLMGTSFASGRIEIPAGILPAVDNPERAPRDAKGWLSKVLASGYNPARDQLELAQRVDLNVIRTKRMRSFVRLELALDELIAAVRSDKPTVTPSAQ